MVRSRRVVASKASEARIERVAHADPARSIGGKRCVLGTVVHWLVPRPLLDCKVVGKVEGTNNALKVKEDAIRYDQ